MTKPSGVDEEPLKSLWILLQMLVSWWSILFSSEFLKKATWWNRYIVWMCNRQSRKANTNVRLFTPVMIIDALCTRQAKVTFITGFIAYFITLVYQISDSYFSHQSITSNVTWTLYTQQHKVPINYIGPGQSLNKEKKSSF